MDIFWRFKQAAKNENFRGNLVVYRDKASGSRVEIKSLPTLYPAVHPFHPIPLYPLGRMLWISLKTYTECVPYIYYPCLRCDEKENKDLIDLIWTFLSVFSVYALMVFKVFQKAFTSVHNY